MSSPREVRPFVIKLRQALSETVDPRRLELHQWTASQLSDSRTFAPPPTTTTYLSFEQVYDEAARIDDLLPGTEDFGPADVLVFDLTATSYDLLRDPFLLQLSHAVTTRVEHSARTAIVLLPYMPALSAPFWEGFRYEPDASSPNVVVVAGDGTVDWVGDPAHETPPDFAAGFAARRSRLLESTAEVFDKKLLRRRGHFASQDAGGRQECRDTLLDASGCLRELRELLWDKLEPIVAGFSFSNVGLIVAGPHAPWMVEACRSVREEQGLDLVVLPTDLKEIDASAFSEKNVIVSGVVHRGDRLLKVAETLADAGIHFSPRAIVAIKAKSFRSPAGALLTVDAIHSETITTFGETCRQCELELPFSPIDLESEPYVQTTAYDFWSMIGSVEWEKESYGVGEPERYQYDPNYGSVFERYGGWIAFRYQRLIEYLNLQGELVVVCPKERAVTTLVDKLRYRLEGRMSVVAVERDIFEEKLPASSNPELPRQLRHLSNARPTVLILDEFNGSNKTRNNLVRFLREHDVEVFAYLPFVDRVGGPSDPKSPIVRPLYDLASPRRA